MDHESLAEFELLVMLAAMRLGPEEAYTVTIAEDIRQRTGRSVRRANVYTTLSAWRPRVWCRAVSEIPDRNEVAGRRGYSKCSRRGCRP